jgi:hypothetical protein
MIHAVMRNMYCNGYTVDQANITLVYQTNVLKSWLFALQSPSFLQPHAIHFMFFFIFIMQSL